MEIKRELYLNQLISRKGNGFIKVITGIRRCGKSCFLLSVMEDLKANGVSEKNIVNSFYDNLLLVERAEKLPAAPFWVMMGFGSPSRLIFLTDLFHFFVSI